MTASSGRWSLALALALEGPWQSSSMVRGRGRESTGKDWGWEGEGELVDGKGDDEDSGATNLPTEVDDWVDRIDAGWPVLWLFQQFCDSSGWQEVQGSFLLAQACLTH